jgi:hypothetical protein
MPGPMRWLLVLLMACTVAPVSAERLSALPPAASTQANGHASDCPYERARQAAAAARLDRVVIPVAESDPPEGSLFDPARRSVFAP